MAGPSTAEIGREIDRLVIAVHRRVMSTNRAELRAALEPLALDQPGQIYDLAEFVAAGRCSVDVTRRRFPYDADDRAAAMVGRLLADDRLDGQLRPNAELEAVVDGILDLRADAAAELWGWQLTDPLQGAAEGFAAASGPLVDAFRRLPEPAVPAHRLHHLLTGLRYARLEAHVAAWEGAGLAAAEIVALSVAVGSESTVAPQGRLVTRGWLTADGSATVEGHQARAGIEAETDARCTAMFQAVTDLAGWFGTLQRLGGQVGIGHSNP